MRETVQKRMVAMSTWGINQPARINIKKIITPRLIVQKEISLSIPRGEGTWFFISAKITDMLMRDIGKEKPRKKVSRVSFSKANQCPNSLLRMARLEMPSPSERQSRDA